MVDFKMGKTHKSNFNQEMYLATLFSRALNGTYKKKKGRKKSSIKKFCHSVHVFLHKKFCSFPVV